MSTLGGRVNGPRVGLGKILSPSVFRRDLRRTAGFDLLEVFRMPGVQALCTRA